MNNKPKRLSTSQSVTIVVALIGFIGAIGAAIIGIIPLLPAKLPPPLPTGLPTPTPLPTVVGTPLKVGADIAASGPIGFTVKAYDVSLVVDEVLAYRTDSKGNTEIPGYTDLLIKMRIVNQNPSVYIFSRGDIVVVDDFSNEYHTWGNLNSSFPDILSVAYNQSVVGGLVYRIPSAALDNNLVLVLDTISHETTNISIRIVIPLGIITSQP